MKTIVDDDNDDDNDDEEESSEDDAFQSKNESNKIKTAWRCQL